jgi:hypothetical protein
MMGLDINIIDFGWLYGMSVIIFGINAVIESCSVYRTAKRKHMDTLDRMNSIMKLGEVEITYGGRIKRLGRPKTTFTALRLRSDPFGGMRYIFAKNLNLPL